MSNEEDKKGRSKKKLPNDDGTEDEAEETLDDILGDLDKPTEDEGQTGESTEETKGTQSSASTTPKPTDSKGSEPPSKTESVITTLPPKPTESSPSANELPELDNSKPSVVPSSSNKEVPDSETGAPNETKSALTTLTPSNEQSNTSNVESLEPQPMISTIHGESGQNGESETTLEPQPIMSSVHETKSSANKGAGGVDPLEPQPVMSTVHGTSSKAGDGDDDGSLEAQPIMSSVHGTTSNVKGDENDSLDPQPIMSSVHGTASVPAKPSEDLPPGSSRTKSGSIHFEEAMSEIYGKKSSNEILDSDQTQTGGMTSTKVIHDSPTAEVVNAQDFQKWQDKESPTANRLPGAPQGMLASAHSSELELPVPGMCGPDGRLLGQWELDLVPPYTFRQGVPGEPGALNTCATDKQGGGPGGSGMLALGGKNYPFHIEIVWNDEEDKANQNPAAAASASLTAPQAPSEATLANMESNQGCVNRTSSGFNLDVVPPYTFRQGEGPSMTSNLGQFGGGEQQWELGSNGPFMCQPEGVDLYSVESGSTLDSCIPSDETLVEDCPSDALLDQECEDDEYECVDDRGNYYSPQMAYGNQSPWPQSQCVPENAADFQNATNFGNYNQWGNNSNNQWCQPALSNANNGGCQCPGSIVQSFTPPTSGGYSANGQQCCQEECVEEVDCNPEGEECDLQLNNLVGFGAEVLGDTTRVAWSILSECLEWINKDTFTSLFTSSSANDDNKNVPVCPPKCVGTKTEANKSTATSQIYLQFMAQTEAKKAGSVVNEAAIPEDTQNDPSRKEVSVIVHKASIEPPSEETKDAAETASGLEKDSLSLDADNSEAGGRRVSFSSTLKARGTQDSELEIAITEGGKPTIPIRKSSAEGGKDFNSIMEPPPPRMSPPILETESKIDDGFLEPQPTESSSIPSQDPAKPKTKRPQQQEGGNQTEDIQTTENSVMARSESRTANQ